VPHPLRSFIAQRVGDQRPESQAQSGIFRFVSGHGFSHAAKSKISGLQPLLKLYSQMLCPLKSCDYEKIPNHVAENKALAHKHLKISNLPQLPQVGLPMLPYSSVKHPHRPSNS
jgi:hypothetical protein